MPTDAQNDQIRGFIADARRQAATGNFAEAQALLRKADKVIPDLPATAQARSDIAAMATPQGQLATQLARARAAIDQNDSAAAEKALVEAERVNPQAPEIAELREALQTAQQKERGARTASRHCWRRCARRSHATTGRWRMARSTRRNGSTSRTRRCAKPGVELSRAQNASLKNETQTQKNSAEMRLTGSRSGA